MLKFKHSGATGDIIFSLPLIKHMGGGELYITMQDKQRATSIAQLINEQPYITHCYATAPAPDDCIDLDRFRSFAHHHSNLIEDHFKGVGIPIPDGVREPWLTLPELPEPLIWAGDYAVINWTPRYEDPAFDWAAEVKYLLTFNKRVYFLGYRGEYDEFQQRFNTEAEFYDCNFLLAAYMIKYASVATCGYSAMATIAQGLGGPVRLVQAPGHTLSTLFVERETIINQ